MTGGPEPRWRDAFVDYARLGLAICVCIEHVPAYNLWPTNGYRPVWAVPAFLAISGYYVLQSYEMSTTWGNFIWKRALRVTPGLLVGLGLAFLARGAPGVVGSLRAYATLGYRSNGAIMPVWSLGVEEIAYGALAVGFALGAYRRRWPIWIAFVAACILATAIQGGEATQKDLNVIPSFFVGSLAYIYRQKLTGSQWALAILIPVGVAAAVELPLASRGHWVPGVCLGLGIIGVRGLKLPRIPDFSYGIYIYHMPLYVWLFAGFHVPAAAYFACLLVLCTISWYCVEKPALGLKSWAVGVKGAFPP